MSLGDVESERDNLLEKLSDYDKVRQQLAELEEREALYIKSIDDLKTKHTFILVKNGNIVICSRGSVGGCGAMVGFAT